MNSCGGADGARARPCGRTGGRSTVLSHRSGVGEAMHDHPSAGRDGRLVHAAPERACRTNGLEPGSRHGLCLGPRRRRRVRRRDRRVGRPDVRGRHAHRARRATDAFGRTGTEERSLGVQEPPNAVPTLEIGAPSWLEIESTYTFHAMAADADGAVVKFELDLDGDGTYETSESGSPAEGWAGHFWLGKDVTFHTPGPRVLRARVTDDRARPRWPRRRCSSSRTFR